MALRPLYWHRRAVKRMDLANAVLAAQNASLGRRAYVAVLRFFRWYRRQFGLDGRWYYEKRLLLEAATVATQLAAIFGNAARIDSWWLLVLVCVVSLNLFATPLYSVARSQTIRRDVGVIFDVCVDMAYVLLNLFLKSVDDMSAADAFSIAVPCAFNCVRCHLLACSCSASEFCCIAGCTISHSSWRCSGAMSSLRARHRLLPRSRHLPPRHHQLLRRREQRSCRPRE